jgi:hypothetical protein
MCLFSFLELKNTALWLLSYYSGPSVPQSLKAAFIIFLGAQKYVTMTTFVLFGYRHWCCHGYCASTVWYGWCWLLSPYFGSHLLSSCTLDCGELRVISLVSKHADGLTGSSMYAVSTWSLCSEGKYRFWQPPSNTVWLSGGCSVERLQAMQCSQYAVPPQSEFRAGTHLLK